MQAGVRVHDSDHRRDTQSKREDYREADGQLHQRLTPAADQGVNCSFGTTTRACSGRPPMPGASGTSAGATPPTSTSTASPRSIAQTQTGGGADLPPGHQAAGATPISPAESACRATREATAAPPPATEPARAPAREAARTVYASAAQTAASTVASTISRATGHASANSTRAVAPCARLTAGSAAMS